MKTITIKNRGHKQVRENMWECNSSSSHSVTIRNKTVPKSTKPVREFVTDNILYPNVLCDYVSSFGYDSSSTCCDTKDKKAAIVCNWVNYVIQDAFWDVGDIPNREITREIFLGKLLQKFANACGYDGVDMDSLTDAFNPLTDDGDTLPYEVAKDTQEEFENAVMDMVEIVLDNNMIIEESYIEN